MKYFVLLFSIAFSLLFACNSSKTEKKLNESISPKKLLYENVSDYSDIFSNNKNVLWAYRRCIDNTLKRVLSDKWSENNQYSEGSSSGIYDLEQPGRSVINKLNTNYIFGQFENVIKDSDTNGNKRYIMDFFVYQMNSTAVNDVNHRIIVDLTLFYKTKTIQVNTINFSNAFLLYRNSN